MTHLRLLLSLSPSQKFKSSKCRDPKRQCRECENAPPAIPPFCSFFLSVHRDQLVRGRKLSQCSTKWPRLMQPARRLSDHIWAMPVSAMRVQTDLGGMYLRCLQWEGGGGYPKSRCSKGRLREFSTMNWSKM